MLLSYFRKILVKRKILIKVLQTIHIKKLNVINLFLLQLMKIHFAIFLVIIHILNNEIYEQKKKINLYNKLFIVKLFSLSANCMYDALCLKPVFVFFFRQYLISFLSFISSIYLHVIAFRFVLFVCLFEKKRRIFF